MVPQDWPAAWGTVGKDWSSMLLMAKLTQPEQSVTEVHVPPGVDWKTQGASPGIDWDSYEYSVQVVCWRILDATD
jgi:hypothetical protein